MRALTLFHAKSLKPVAGAQRAARDSCIICSFCSAIPAPKTDLRASAGVENPTARAIIPMVIFFLILFR